MRSMHYDRHGKRSEFCRGYGITKKDSKQTCVVEIFLTLSPDLYWTRISARVNLQLRHIL